MAAFSNLVITENGQELIARVIAGSGKVEFTNICASDAEYTIDELEYLTELSGIRQTTPVLRVIPTNSVTVKVETQFTNIELNNGYHIRTMGLYAYDPLSETEILYAVCIEITGSCYMPVYNGVTVSGVRVQFITTVGNASNVSLRINVVKVASLEAIQGELRQSIDRLELAIAEMNDRITTFIENGGGGGTGVPMTQEYIDALFGDGGQSEYPSEEPQDLPNGDYEFATNEDIDNLFDGDSGQQIATNEDIDNLFDGESVENQGGN